MVISIDKVLRCDDAFTSQWKGPSLVKAIASTYLSKKIELYTIIVFQENVCDIIICIRFHRGINMLNFTAKASGLVMPVQDLRLSR